MIICIALLAMLALIWLVVERWPAPISNGSRTTESQISRSELLATSSINDISFIDGGRRTIGIENNNLRIWNTADGEQMSIIASQHESQLVCVTESPDGKFVLSANSAGDVEEWNSATFAHMREFRINDRSIRAMRINESRNYLALSVLKSIEVWAIGDSGIKPFKVLKLVSDRGIVCWSRDGQRMMYGPIENWSLGILSLADRQETTVLKNHDRDILCCAEFLRKSDEIVVSSGLRTLLIRPSDDGEVYDFEQRGIVEIACSPDGRYLGMGDEAGNIHIWNVAKKSKTVSFHAYDAGIQRIVFSSDSSRLASLSCDIGFDDLPGHSDLKVWSVPDGKLKWTCRRP